MFMVISVHLELVTVLSSNLPARNAFSIADAGGFPLWLFSNLYDYITPELVLKLNLLKDRMGIKSFR